MNGTMLRISTMLNFAPALHTVLDSDGNDLSVTQF
jgi:hypothetical protein